MRTARHELELEGDQMVALPGIVSPEALARVVSFQYIDLSRTIL